MKSGIAIHRMELERAEHHVYRLEYHVVWTPKYRHPVFKEPYREELKQMIVKAGYDYDINVEEIEIPKDHVHALVGMAPRISVSECVRVLKSISAREFFRKYPEIREKYFWGGKLWSPSYYVETIGQRNEAAIRQYIEGQLREEDRQVERMRQLKLF